jgi:hypothetical protein
MPLLIRTQAQREERRRAESRFDYRMLVARMYPLSAGTFLSVKQSPVHQPEELEAMNAVL